LSTATHRIGIFKSAFDETLLQLVVFDPMDGVDDSNCLFTSQMTNMHHQCHDNS
jgi:hypothetical protein